MGGDGGDGMLEKTKPFVLCCGVFSQGARGGDGVFALVFCFFFGRGGYSFRFGGGVDATPSRKTPLSPLLPPTRMRSPKTTFDQIRIEVGGEEGL